jgi:hypothetical protein
MELDMDGETRRYGRALSAAVRVSPVLYQQ